MFNPKLTDFVKENKDLTIMGLVWAGWWRIYVIFFGICMAIALFSSIFE